MPHEARHAPLSHTQEGSTRHCRSLQYKEGDVNVPIANSMSFDRQSTYLRRRCRLFLSFLQCDPARATQQNDQRPAHTTQWLMTEKRLRTAHQQHTPLCLDLAEARLAVDLPKPATKTRNGCKCIREHSRASRAPHGGLLGVTIPTTSLRREPVCPETRTAPVVALDSHGTTGAVLLVALCV